MVLLREVEGIVIMRGAPLAAQPRNRWIVAHVVLLMQRIDRSLGVPRGGNWRI
jgi:hypothetical protein